MCHFDWPRQKGILSVASPSSLPGWEKSKEVQLMKKTFRRALSLTIASGLTLAMAVTAGAAEGDTLTRGEMAKLLVEGAGLTGQVEQYQAQESVFQDVPEDSEYKGYINLAYAQGLVSGTGADTFSPDAQTTQVEAAAAIMQYAGVPEEMLTSWPADYSTTAARVGLTEGITYSADAAVTEGQFQTMLENGSSLVGKPYIGITWKANDQDYAGFKAVIEAAGGNPVVIFEKYEIAPGYIKGEDSLEFLSYNTGNCDMYAGGSLTVAGETQKKGDLAFAVYEYEVTTYFSLKQYAVICAGLLLLAAGLTFGMRRAFRGRGLCHGLPLRSPDRRGKD